MPLADPCPGMPAGLAAALACPACHGDLRLDGDRLACGRGDCAGAYGLTDGVPVFLDAAAYDTQIADFEAMDGTGELSKKTAGSPGLREWILANQWVLGPPISRDVGDAARMTRIRGAYASAGGLVVDLGSQGPGRWPEAIGVDAEARPGVGVVCDAHRLPFADGSLGLVLTNSMFEHLRRPATAAGEIYRCLRPGGVLYLDVPWMYELHGCPMDFQRWTQAGLRELLHDFEVLEEGVIGGPGAVAARMLRGLVFALTPGRRLRYVARVAATWGLFWMKYLDAWIPAARRAPFAQGYWVLARRPE